MRIATPIIAGAALLALSNVALAETALAGPDQPILLTDAQMDSVSAGGVRFVFDLTGDALGNGNFNFDNLPGEFSEANLAASITQFSGVVDIRVRVEADTFD